MARTCSQRLPAGHVHTWAGMGSPGDPLGVPWWVMVVGEGLCAAPAYWCTDFLLVQRAMAARDSPSARKTPLVAAIPKMFFPCHRYSAGHDCASHRAGELFTRQLQSRASGHADEPVLRPRHAGSGRHGASGKFHVGDGRQYNGIQHGIHLRHLSNICRGKSGPTGITSIVGKVATDRRHAHGVRSSFIVLYFNNLMDYMPLIAVLFISPFFSLPDRNGLGAALPRRPDSSGMLGGLAAATTEYHFVSTQYGAFRLADGLELWIGHSGIGGRTDGNNRDTLSDTSSRSCVAEGPGVRTRECKRSLGSLAAAGIKRPCFMRSSSY